MTDEYSRIQNLKTLALGELPATPTRQSCDVERVATDIVHSAEVDCRRSAVGCAVCNLSGLSCEGVVAVARGYDALGSLTPRVRSLRGSGPGFAG